MKCVLFYGLSGPVHVYITQICVFLLVFNSFFSFARLVFANILNQRNEFTTNRLSKIHQTWFVCVADLTQDVAQSVSHNERRVKTKPHPHPRHTQTPPHTRTHTHIHRLTHFLSVTTHAYTLKRKWRQLYPHPGFEV